jgi:hypothetical protein
MVAKGGGWQLGRDDDHVVLYERGQSWGIKPFVG